RQRIGRRRAGARRRDARRRGRAARRLRLCRRIGDVELQPHHPAHRRPPVALGAGAAVGRGVARDAAGRRTGRDARAALRRHRTGRQAVRQDGHAQRRQRAVGLSGDGVGTHLRLLRAGERHAAGCQRHPRGRSRAAGSGGGAL
ncbi:hypothetical protein LTR94_029714, partial [Friedmanniomyces endolithicus]